MTPEALINDLFRRKVCWLSDQEDGNDIAISSRIRFARNLKGERFPVNANDKALCAIRDEILDAIRDDAKNSSIRFCEFLMDELSPLDRKFLLERHLISRELTNPRNGSALVTNREQGTFIMINEEDHLRIQVLAPGFQFKKLYARIDSLDNRLAARLNYAFRQDLGYLTACPTNLGTAMRASVMLHLLGLVLSGQIAAVLQGIKELGLTARGLFGEGSENQGNIFQISNQTSLGETEEQIIERIENVVSRIIMHERKARSILLGAKENVLLNHISRAYGLLQHSYMINEREAIHALSAVRLGKDMKMFRNISVKNLNRLFLLVQSAHLQKHSLREMESAEEDSVRAALLRSYFPATGKSGD